MVGAFQPPPPKAPMTRPMCPLAPPIVARPDPPTLRCPTCPRSASLPSTAPRFFIGFGAFVGSGIFEKLNAGPRMLLGFVPFRRFPQIHLEWETSWTAQTLQSVRVQAIPLIGSACWVRGIVRFCGGVATTILLSNEISKYDSLHLMFGPNVRIGTELFNHGPFSIRADVFGRIATSQKSFGAMDKTLGRVLPFAAGLALMGMWAAD